MAAACRGKGVHVKTVRYMMLGLTMLCGGVSRGQVSPITKETVAAAIGVGRTAKSTSDFIYRAQARTRLTSKGGVRGFDLVFMTPRAVIAHRASDARKLYEDIDASSIDFSAEKLTSLTIVATPSDSLSGAFVGQYASLKDSVAIVVIRVDGHLIKPTREERFDVPFTNAYGKTDIYQGGRFSFPLDAIQLNAKKLEVVVVPDNGLADDEAVLSLNLSDRRKIK